MQQQDCEDSIVDHGAHQVRHPVHQCVQVQRSVQCVGKPLEEGDLNRLKANSWVRSMRMKQRPLLASAFSRRRRAVISFKLLCSASALGLWFNWHASR